MKTNQKLYDIDISGKLYTYTVTKITNEGIELVPDENPRITHRFTIEQAVMLFMKGSTLEDAKADAERRKELMGISA